MAKWKTDILSDAKEHADHNFNSYYWFNRVDSITNAKMRASLAFSWIDVVLFSIGLLLFLFVDTIDKSSWLYFLMIGYWVIFLIISLLRWERWVEIRNAQKEAQRTTYRPKDRKKKLPKRRKDYGHK